MDRAAAVRGESGPNLELFSWFIAPTAAPAARPHTSSWLAVGQPIQISENNLRDTPCQRFLRVHDAEPPADFAS
jgi:hypothetical protein